MIISGLILWKLEEINHVLIAADLLLAVTGNAHRRRERRRRGRRFSERPVDVFLFVVVWLLLLIIVAVALVVDERVSWHDGEAGAAVGCLEVLGRAAAVPIAAVGGGRGRARTHEELGRGRAVDRQASRPSAGCWVPSKSFVLRRGVWPEDKKHQRIVHWLWWAYVCSIVVLYFLRFFSQQV